jgi:tetratricopeptide (TPR) repeat protein
MDKKAHPGVTYRIRQIIGMALALYALSLTPGVDNAAHIGGLIAGIICGVAFQRLSDFKVLWCPRDFIVTIAMAALFVGALYGEEYIYSQDKTLPAALLLRDGVESLQKNDLARAMTKLDSALNIDPKNERALLMRSTINLALGHYPPALLDIAAAIAIEPRDAMAYNQRACVYLAMEQYKEALADARQAVEYDKHLAPAIDTEATALAYLGQFDQALAAINRAIEEDNGASGICFYHRAIIYTALGDKDKAASDLGQAKKLGYDLEGWERDRPLPKSVPQA